MRDYNLTIVIVDLVLKANNLIPIERPGYPPDAIKMVAMMNKQYYLCEGKEMEELYQASTMFSATTPPPTAAGKPAFITEGGGIGDYHSLIHPPELVTQCAAKMAVRKENEDKAAMAAAAAGATTPAPKNASDNVTTRSLEELRQLLSDDRQLQADFNDTNAT